MLHTLDTSPTLAMELHHKLTGRGMGMRMGMQNNAELERVAGVAKTTRIKEEQRVTEILKYVLLVLFGLLGFQYCL